jgi:hypothetical protein
MNATGALTLVRERTKRYIPVVMGDVDALTIALTCATMERDSLLELSHDKIVSTEALRFADQLKMTCDEFNELFCSPTTATTKPLVGTRRGIASLQATTAALQLQDNLVETKELHATIEAALCTTLSESSQKASWSTPRVRRLAVLTLLREDDADALACLRHVLGEVVGSDLRRWEDLREQQRVSGLDLMLVSETLATIANTV